MKYIESKSYLWHSPPLVVHRVQGCTSVDILICCLRSLTSPTRSLAIGPSAELREFEVDVNGVAEGPELVESRFIFAKPWSGRLSMGAAQDVGP